MSRISVMASQALVRGRMGRSTMGILSMLLVAAAAVTHNPSSAGAATVTVAPNDVNRIIAGGFSDTHYADFFSLSASNFQKTLLRTTTQQFLDALESQLGPAPGYTILSARITVGSDLDDFAVDGAPVHEMLVPYNAANVTYNFRDTSVPLTWGVAGGQAGTDYAGTPVTTGAVVGNTTEFSGLEALVQSWLNGATNNGLYFPAAAVQTVNTYTGANNVVWTLEAVAVPEPSSMTILALGSVLFLARRRKHQQAA